MDDNEQANNYIYLKTTEAITALNYKINTFKKKQQ